MCSGILSRFLVSSQNVFTADHFPVTAALLLADFLFSPVVFH